MKNSFKYADLNEIDMRVASLCGANVDAVAITKKDPKRYRVKWEKFIPTIAIAIAIMVFVGMTISTENHYNCVGHFEYTVVEGDTISGILDRYYGNDPRKEQIFRDSCGFPTVGDIIYEGQTVELPLYKWNSTITTGVVEYICGNEIVVTVADGNQYGYYDNNPDSIELGDTINLIFLNENTLVKAWK